MTAEPRDVEEIATPDADREWFVAGVEDDDEHPWWIWSFTQCAAGDECDHDECKPVPVVALHAPEDGDRFDVEDRLAHWIAAAHNDAARLAAADRENASGPLLARLNAAERERDFAYEVRENFRATNVELRGEVERHEVFMRAIKDCRDDPARAIAQNDIINGKAVIAGHIAEAERDDLRAQLAAAQAQLAEARAWLALVRDWPSCGESTGIASNRCMLPPGHVGAHDCQLVPGSFAYFAALSAAPQPEPDVRAENLRRLRQRPCCRDHADATPEPPASDEPARCEP